jgi:uncharacterized protein YxjI
LNTCAILLALCLLAVPAMAGERTIIKPDPFQSDRYQIMDSHGNSVGTIKKDALDSRRLQIYTGNGELTHIVKPSTLPTSHKRYDTFTPSGEPAGSICQDPLRGDRYQLNGKTIKRDTLRPERWGIEK